MIWQRLMKVFRYTSTSEGIKRCPQCNDSLGLLRRKEFGMEIKYHYCPTCRAYIPIQHAI